MDGYLVGYSRQITLSVRSPMIYQLTRAQTTYPSRSVKKGKSPSSQPRALLDEDYGKIPKIHRLKGKT